MKSLQSMKLSQEEATEYSQPTAMADLPEYPYGLEISLNDEALDSLGLENLPEVGKEMIMTARVKVCGTNAYQTLGGEQEKSLRLQITDMALDEEGDVGTPGDKLYS